MLFWLIESIQLAYKRDTRNAVRAFRRLEGETRAKLIKDMARILDAQEQGDLERDPEKAFRMLMRSDQVFRSIFYARCRKQGRTDARLKDLVRRSELHLPGDPTIILHSDDMGGGLRIIHGNVGIGAQVRIGSNVTLSGQALIGKRHRGSPVIGDNVRIHTKATILGPVSVGDNAEIGAASLVLEDVPANSVAAGSPARIISERES